LFRSPRITGSEAQEVHRLAQLKHAVHQRLARLALAQADELGGMGFEQLGRLDQQLGACRPAERVPARLRRLSAGEHEIDIGGSSVEYLADDRVVVLGRADQAWFDRLTTHGAGVYR